MTSLPDPASLPCMNRRARLVLTPGLSLSYQDRISLTLGVSRMAASQFTLAVDRLTRTLHPRRLDQKAAGAASMAGAATSRGGRATTPDGTSRRPNPGARPR